MAATNSTSIVKPLAFTRLYRREYSIWVGMRRRCKNPRYKGYRYYGGRGIRVCRRWSGKKGFEHFLADMGPQPFRRAGLHREDNDGDYTPKNVAWAGPKVQGRNRRSNRVLSFQGRRMILIEWAEELHMKPATLGARLAKGWPVKKAFTVPVGLSHGGGRKGNKRKP